MKRVLKLVVGNAAVLAAMLLVLELALRGAGVDTAVEVERRDPAWEQRYQVISEKLRNGTLEFQDSFRTDGEGLFKANPDYFERSGEGIIVNRDGFRGRPFDFTNSPCTRILLIGDSFVWGANAEPLTNCFADRLETAGYRVYNAGIPGTDPEQYARIAEKYTPLLKPDVVAVCLYMGNDLSTRPQIMRPHKRLHYATNGGWLRGYDDYGRFFESERDVVEYLKRKCGYCPGPWDYLRFKTAIGRLLAGAIARDTRMAPDPARRWVRACLNRIRDVSVTHGATCLVFLIPCSSTDSRPHTRIENNLPLFEGFQYVYPDTIQPGDYRDPPDTHFNNEGHRKYAEFMLDVLAREGLAPSPGQP